MTRALRTARLELVPLTVRHAEAMTVVLAAPELYRFIGGEPPTVDRLRDRYARQVIGGPADGTQVWHNWIARSRADDAAIGYVQATVTGDTADVAWVIGPAWQGRGYAREAAVAMVDALTADGVRRIVAHVQAENLASAAVARSLGMDLTGRVVDGEDEWVRDAGPSE